MKNKTYMERLSDAVGPIDRPEPIWQTLVGGLFMTLFIFALLILVIGFGA